MPTKIENLTNRPVLLRCNSGETLHIAPRAISADVLDVEVKDNLAVQKLKDRHIIALHEAEGKPAKKEKAERTKEEKAKTKK